MHLKYPRMKETQPGRQRSPNAGGVLGFRIASGHRLSGTRHARFSQRTRAPQRSPGSPDLGSHSYQLAIPLNLPKSCSCLVTCQASCCPWIPSPAALRPFLLPPCCPLHHLYTASSDVPREKQSDAKQRNQALP